MKKWMLVAALVAAVLPIWAEQVGYTVKGKCPKDEVKVYLMEKSLTNMAIIDSVVAKGGRFAFKGVLEENALLAVGYEGGNRNVMFFNDGKPVEIDLATYKLSGSAQNEKLASCDVAVSQLEEVMRGISNDYRDIQANASLTLEQKEAKARELQPRVEKLVDDYRTLFKQARKLTRKKQ